MICDLRKWRWLFAGFIFVASFVRAQVPYVTNLSQAYSIASNSHSTVILYTGRAAFCGTNDGPRGYFFNFILSNYPELATRSNKYVVCEQFMYAPNTPNGPSPQFFWEMDQHTNLFERYHIRTFNPTLTFVDAKGEKLNGPFTGYYPMPDFGAGSDDCYESLRQYLRDDPPLRLEQAQSNLMAAVCVTNARSSGLEFFRYKRHSEGKQKPIMVDSGLYSDEYEIGAPFKFVVREAGVARGNFSSGGYDESLIAVLGNFEGPERLHEKDPFLVRLNGAWFRGYMEFVGHRPDHWKRFSSVTLRDDEYYFGIYTRDKAVGRKLLEEFKKLRPKESEEKAK